MPVKAQVVDENQERNPKGSMSPKAANRQNHLTLDASYTVT
jgi:hypothetical protein